MTRLQEGLAAGLGRWRAPRAVHDPGKLRFRLLATAGRLARGGRRLQLRIDASRPWAPDLTAAFTRLAGLTPG